MYRVCKGGVYWSTHVKGSFGSWVNRRESEGKFPQERADVIIPLERRKRSGGIAEGKDWLSLYTQETKNPRRLDVPRLGKETSARRRRHGERKGRGKETGAFLFLRRLLPIPILRFTSEPKRALAYRWLQKLSLCILFGACGRKRIGEPVKGRKQSLQPCRSSALFSWLIQPKPVSHNSVFFSLEISPATRQPASQ